MRIEDVTSILQCESQAAESLQLLTRTIEPNARCFLLRRARASLSRARELRQASLRMAPNRSAHTRNHISAFGGWLAAFDFTNPSHSNPANQVRGQI